MRIALNPCTPAPGIRRFTVPLAFPSPDHLHIHVLDTADGELMVDCGAIGSEAGLAAGLAAVGASPAQILITHGHVDHWGLATTLVDEVLAHPGVIPALRWGQEGQSEPRYGAGAPSAKTMEAAFEPFTALYDRVPRVRGIQAGDRFGDWEVVTTPGHDQGHVCLYRPIDGVLLCGDLLLPGFTPNVQPSWDGSDALADFLGSLERIGSLPVSLVLPAHGEPYTDAHARAEELLHHHHLRLAKLRDALASGPRAIGELRDAVFGARFGSPADAMMAELETYAHLDHLRRRSEVRLEPGGDWALAR